LPLSVSTKPDQESGSPQLLVWHVATELVGEVEPELAEGMVEIGRDRRLHQPRTNGRLLCQATHVGQPAGELAALGEQQLEGLCGDVVPSHAVTSPGLQRQLQSSGISVQGVGYEMTAQSTSRRAATARFETVL
jgi:hypothetical protein